MHGCQIIRRTSLLLVYSASWCDEVATWYCRRSDTEMKALLNDLHTLGCSIWFLENLGIDMPEPGFPVRLFLDALGPGALLTSRVHVLMWLNMPSP